MSIRLLYGSYSKNIKNIEIILECNKIDKENYKNLKLIETNLKDRIQNVTDQVKVMDTKIIGNTHDVLEKWKNTRSKQWKQKSTSKNDDSDKVSKIKILRMRNLRKV